MRKMRERLEGIKISSVIINLMVIASVVVALTSGFKFGE
jgi:hypothetical protein